MGGRRAGAQEGTRLLMIIEPNVWSRSIYSLLSGEPDLAADLREASLSGDLGRWTGCLTDLVARSFQVLGLAVAAKGHRCDVLPVCREEYLGHDLMALPREGGAWRYPVAVCELENSARDEVVAYSLWKMLCLRSVLRVVFCYRSASTDAGGLVTHLADEVITALSLTDRQRLTGDTLVFVGSRNESSTFPYNFFLAWRLNSNTGRFERYDWR